MRSIASVVITLLLLIVLPITAAEAAGPARTIISIDAGWRFQESDVPAASQKVFDDSRWTRVDVPHDYVIQGTFAPKAPVGVSAHGYEYHASLPSQPAWYRKQLSIPDSAHGKRVWVEFDGVFSNSDYWINGHALGSQRSGYCSFRYDITDFVNFGSENVLSVRADPHYDGWWYEGGGIYRHVRLVFVDPVHIAPWGVFAASSVETAAGDAHADSTVVVKTDVANESAATVTATLLSEVVDAAGRTVAATQTDQPLAAGASATVSQKVAIENATLWSLENPYLYDLRSTIKLSGKVVDQLTTHIGVRQIRFDAEHGFLLNGKRVELKGVNCHQDHAGVGVALPDRLIEWRLQRLKEVGCNAIRMSHNPVEPVMLDLCDRMGILVIAENRHLGDTYDGQTVKSTPAVEHHDLSSLVMRDRNHPSIILWSLCNEQRIQRSPEAAAIALAMKERVNELDGTRPITAAMNGGFTAPEGMAHVLDVVGFNYQPGVYDGFHMKFPDKPIVATEIASEVATRGVYEMKHWDKYWGDKALGFMAAYSINAGPGGQTVEDAWPPVAKREFIAGGFVWSGFDYKGEPRPFGWPSIGSQYGMMDECGFPKDSYYYYKAWWTNEPVLHIFPHWNWPGKEGQEIPVWVHSNCQEVELFLNGVSQGRQTVKPLHHLEWKVKYAPGTLTARGMRDGKPIEESVETTGVAAGVRLIADRTHLAADNSDLSIITVQIIDAKGRVVPVADNNVMFSIAGPGKLIGVGNGDPTSHEPDQSNQRKVFNGLAQAIVQTTPMRGDITIKAQSEGLESATLALVSK